MQRFKDGNKLFDPKSIGIIFRYPPNQLSILIKSPCPVSISSVPLLQKLSVDIHSEKYKNLNSKERMTLETIRSSKRLRELVNYREKDTCNTCKFNKAIIRLGSMKDRCPFRDIESHLNSEYFKMVDERKPSKGIMKLNKNKSASMTDIIQVLAGNYERVLDEQRTEELRVQIINKEVIQSWEETGIHPSQIIGKEESEAIEHQSMVELIKEREIIKQSRELEEK